MFLEQKHFVIILMSNAEVKILKDFANTIAIYGTRVTGYNFNLHSIVIVDKLHKAFH